MLDFLNFNNKKSILGFTLIEILIVMGVSVILFATVTGVYLSLRREGNVNSDAQKIASVLRLAQNRTLAAQSLSPHGVHFDSVAGTYTLFEGSSFDSMDSGNEVNDLDASVEILNIQLAGGGSDVIFNRLSGDVAAPGFIEIARKDDSSIRSIMCIDPTGSIRILGDSEPSSSCDVTALQYTDGLTNADLASFPSNSAYGDPAQSFTTDSDTIYLNKAELYLRYNDDDVDTVFSDVFLEIRESSTTGSVIGKSTLVDGDSISSALSWTQFIFPLSVELQPSTTYFMRLRSLPSSSIAGSGAEGSIIWGYEHSASAPPAYAGGDVWRYVGANDNPADTGQQLGPADQYDFSFRLYSRQQPPLSDSRHLEFDLGFSLRDHTDITLDFNSGAHVETITIADSMNGDSTVFEWEDTIDVAGNEEVIKIHSLYIDDNDTVFSVHRDQEINDLALDVDIDATDLVDYTSGGVPTKGATIGSMIYR